MTDLPALAPRLRNCFRKHPEILAVYAFGSVAKGKDRRCREMDLSSDLDLGIPGSSAELFEILSSAKIIPQPLARRFKDHVGLRDLMVHGYDKLDYAKLRKEMPPRIQDISRYLKAIISYEKL